MWRIVVAIATITVGFSNIFCLMHLYMSTIKSNKYSLNQTYFVLFLIMSHVDLYLEKFSSIYYTGPMFVIREQIPTNPF